MRLTPSIRRRLVAILIGLFVFTWLTSFGAIYTAANQRIGELFDAQLAHDAGALMVLAEQGSMSIRNRGPSPRAPVNPPHLRKLLAFAIWNGNQLVLQSYNAPDMAFPRSEGYVDITLEKRAWRSFTLRRSQGGITVWVGEPFALRDRIIREISRDLLMPMLLALPLFAFAVWWGVGRGLVPLARVASEVSERSPLNLAPVGGDTVPDEIHVLVDRLNGLLTRLREAFELERRFTGDAAHEIRTPLAGIRTHAQIALRTDDDQQRRQSLMEVIDGVDRTTRLVNQMLTLARLDREALMGEATPVHLADLITTVMTDMQAEAEAKHISLVSTVAADIVLQGYPPALGIMLRNLVDNAIRYTPSGGRVEISADRSHTHVVLRVCDTGPGIPSNERSRVFDRFYRSPGVTAAGCGLGLSIARRVAELHGAILELDVPASGSGLCVQVNLPVTSVGTIPG